ncbi:MAG: type III-B CRISPR module RAMP protein Cmr4 [Candidatus Electrothrix sp. GW3-4]|uniref:type III-B CRISPR module RAMP protein Cmr4 n=1 Tax=Candidatus Electrothrix sp. GW3-4 TaxID=3126740 RepID=UPI0030D5D60F
METMCYYIHALTALHAGTGQGVGVVDLPIAREKSTGLPIVPGSGIKGVLREELNPSNPGTDDLQPCKDEHGQDQSAEECWLTLFGPDAKNVETGKEGSGFAGALNIQDAQLLCLPVRSVYGVFAWVTCPFILQRYKRDLEQIHCSSLPEFPALPQQERGSEEAPLVLTAPGSALAPSGKVFLEDLDFQVADDSAGQTTVGQLAERIAGAVFSTDADWKKFFKERFLIIPDNVFSFLAETATEVRARIKLKEGTRTVEEGALWYEENLPAETLLWGIIGCDRSRRDKDGPNADQLMQHFRDEIGMEKSLQIGGNATVGRGRVRWIPGPVGG